MSPLFDRDDVDLEFYKRNSHPTAREILKDSFYWEIADDYAPIGNDTAADALSIFWPWRDSNKIAPTLWFTTVEFTRWGYSDEQLEQVLKGNWEDRLDSSVHNLAANVFDELVIAIAFGQFIKEGYVDKDLADEALEAINRQLHPEILNDRCSYPSQAKDAFQKTKDALGKMPTKVFSIFDTTKFLGYSIFNFLRGKFKS